MLPSQDKAWLKYYDKKAEDIILPSCSAYECLEKANQDNLNAIALSYFNRNYTYGELFGKINEYAAALQKYGIRQGDIVGVALPTSPEYVFCVYGLNKLGAVADLIDPRAQGDALHHYLEETSRKLVITCDLFSEAFCHAAEDLDFHNIVCVSPYESLTGALKVITSFKKKKKYESSRAISLQQFLGFDKVGDIASVNNEDAIILHTSGTTGDAKSVVVTNNALNAMLCNVVYMGIDAQPGDVMMNQVPPFLAYNIVMAVHMPLCVKCRVVLLPEYEPNKFARNLAKHKPNHVIAGPADWMNFLEGKGVGKDYSFLKTLISGSDSIPTEKRKEVNKILAARGCKSQILEGYGMTEICAAACANVPQHVVDESIGIPLPLNSFCIYDTEDDKELPYGQLGEICMTGPTVMARYANNVKATEEALRRHADGLLWLHSGDLGRIDEDGNLFLAGRIKRVIVRHDGIKISPLLIENVLLKNDRVRNCCVVGINDTSHNSGKKAIAYISLAEEVDEDALVTALMDSCRAELAPYYLPSDIRVIDEIPITTNGKNDYRKVESMVNDR